MRLVVTYDILEDITEYEARTLINNITADIEAVVTRRRAPGRKPLRLASIAVETTVAEAEGGRLLTAKKAG